jgi:tetratricopeptide (TPR) repeat protein
MMDDELSTIVQAFREENTASSLDASAIRRRVLASYQRKPNRRRSATWFLPAAVLLLGSTALAANGTVRLRLARALSWFDRSETTAAADAHGSFHEPGRPNARPALGRVPPTASSAPSYDGSPPAAIAIAEATSAVTATPDRSERDAASQRQRTPPAIRSSTPRRGSVGGKRAGSTASRESDPAGQPPVVEKSAEQDDDLARYQAAHRLHFQDKNPIRALAAWDAYLAAFPKGKLAVEAHFNRALCLIKLGRTAEAEALLQEFATGAFGSYRRTQAADLLDALRRRREPPAR